MSEKELPSVLDLGCGERKLYGSYGVDMLEIPGVDLVHDLDEHPWPLPDGHFEWVRAMDVLEHVDDFVATLKEIHRVLRPGGRFTCKMPFFGSVHHHTDPTHRRSATSRTLDYFCDNGQWQQFQYTEPMFHMEGFSYIREIPVRPPVGSLIRRLDEFMLPLLKRHHDVYEHYGTAWYPVHSIIFELVRL